MPQIPINLGVRSNPGREKEAGQARLVNCYAERADEEGRVQWPLYASDGYQAFATLSGGGATRAMLTLNADALYVVSGAKVFKITSTGVVTDLGSVSASGYATMARNRRLPNNEIGIVTSDGNYYVIDNDVLTQVDVSGFPVTFVSITSLDGYFVLAASNGEWYITSIDNATLIDTLDFEKAQAHPDGLLINKTRGSDLVLFGENSIEFWQDTGAADFPFERTEAVEFGCYSAGSVAEIVVISPGGAIADSIIFAAQDQAGFYVGVMMLSGYSAGKISTLALDRAIRDEPDQASIQSFTWSKDGHAFYCITGSSFTWVYDTATSLWHERESSGLTRWKALHAASLGNKVIVGDYATGELYQMLHTATDEAGATLTWKVIPPDVHAYPNTLRFYDIRANVILGLVAGNLTVRHSNDHGTNWITRTASVASGKRAKILRLGQSKEDGKVFEISADASVVKGIMSLNTNAIQLRG